MQVARNKIMLLLLVAASLALLVVAAPRFLAELMLVPGTPIYERLASGKTVTDDELGTLESSRLDALRFADIPRAHTDLGTSYLVRAQRSTDPDTRQQLALQAIAKLKEGLALDPYNASAWLRITSADIMLGPQYSADALEAWRTSILVAEFDPFLLMQRFQIGTLLYKAMTPDDIVKLKHQLGLAYEYDRWKLFRFVRANNLVLWALVLSPKDIDMAGLFLPRR